MPAPQGLRAYARLCSQFPATGTRATSMTFLRRCGRLMDTQDGLQHGAPPRHSSFKLCDGYM